MPKMVSKISAFGVGFGLGWIFFAPRGTLARWQVIDGWHLSPVASYYTRQGAQDYASELNDEIQWQGWRKRYHAVHKSFTDGWWVSAP